MTHANHPTLPGYNPAQIYFDGCDECEARGDNIELALTYLDRERFAAAWRRAKAWQTHEPGVSFTLSEAEIPLLRFLWYIQVMFERLYGWPLGTLPLDVSGVTI